VTTDTKTHADVATFLAAVDTCARDQTLIRLTLGKPVLKDGPQRGVATPVKAGGSIRYKVVTSTKTQDRTETLEASALTNHLKPLLGATFESANAFTTEADIALIYNRRGEPRLTRAKPTMQAAAPAEHNRTKDYIVDPARPYLRDLDITTPDGVVKPTMYAKFRQICQFIEIVDDVLKGSKLNDAKTIRAVDIGSGKGYLTFALYDYLTTTRGVVCEMTGIERREDLATACRAIAARAKFSGLNFVASTADRVTPDSLNLLIALHACDTATDDAIFLGLEAGTDVILVAPCCQHELAPQLDSIVDGAAAITRFGLFKQRQADLVTDTARTLLMQTQGYSVKVIEFVSNEHTAKNVMLAAVKAQGVNRVSAANDYAALQTAFGFKKQRLADLLAAKSR
jgi:hypothetical protein